MPGDLDLFQLANFNLPTSTLLLSVMIPTCSRNDMLALCLERLKPGVQTLEALYYEVIVSDDGKNNEAKDLIDRQYPWAKWTTGPKQGPAANRNNGARQASGKWLVFTDDDCLPDNNWLQAYTSAIERHPDCKAFEGAILPDDWELLKKDMAECPVNTEGGCFWSANIMVEKQLFETIGGFDEQFKIAAQEDQDLQLQVLKKTGIVFIAAAKIIHPVRIRNLTGLLKQLPARNKNFVYYASKNMAALGYKNVRDIMWKSGLKIQAISFLNNIKNKRLKSACVSFYNFMLYVPKYLFPESGSIVSQNK